MQIEKCVLKKFLVQTRTYFCRNGGCLLAVDDNFSFLTWNHNKVVIIHEEITIHKGSFPTMLSQPAVIIYPEWLVSCKKATNDTFLWNCNTIDIAETDPHLEVTYGTYHLQTHPAHPFSANRGPICLDGGGVYEPRKERLWPSTFGQTMTDVNQLS